jgi:hypothetical protein
MIAIATVLAVSSPQSVAGQRYIEGPGRCPRESALFRQCAIEKAKTFNPPRTPDGKPDLQGFWQRTMLSNDNIEEHPASQGVRADKSMIVDPADGKIPYLPWAAAQRSKNVENKYLDSHTLCYLQGMPRSMYYADVYQVLQPPGSVVFMAEEDHAYRIIPTEERPHIGPNIHLWQGDSRGRWEGNTLVVDVTNQNEMHQFDRAWNFYSDRAHMVERFTLIDPDTIHYEVTVEDPSVYMRPWTMVFPIARLKTEEGFEILEEACYEGNRNWENLRDLGYQLYPGLTPARSKNQ